MNKLITTKDSVNDYLSKRYSNLSNSNYSIDKTELVKKSREKLYDKIQTEAEERLKKES